MGNKVSKSGILWIANGIVFLFASFFFFIELLPAVLWSILVAFIVACYTAGKLKSISMSAQGFMMEAKNGRTDTGNIEKTVDQGQG